VPKLMSSSSYEHSMGSFGEVTFRFQFEGRFAIVILEPNKTDFSLRAAI
jgi:hypothetical protein